MTARPADPCPSTRFSTHWAAALPGVLALVAGCGQVPADRLPTAATDTPPAATQVAAADAPAAAASGADLPMDAIHGLTALRDDPQALAAQARDARAPRLASASR